MASITLIPKEVPILVNSELIRFVKDWLKDTPCIKGDVLPVIMSGVSVSFLVSETEPDGIVMIDPKTNMTILSEPIQVILEEEARKRRFRFNCLQNVEAMYGVDETLFYIKNPEDGESKQSSIDEKEIIKIATELARKIGKSIAIRVEFFEKRGPIEPEGFPWAKVDSLGNTKYTYPDEWSKSSAPE